MYIDINGGNSNASWITGVQVVATEKKVIISYSGGNITKTFNTVSELDDFVATLPNLVSDPNNNQVYYNKNYISAYTTKDIPSDDGLSVGYQLIVNYGTNMGTSKLYFMFATSSERDDFTAELNVESGGSGEGGTTNYNSLTSKPSINNVTLVGNVTLEQLGIEAGLQGEKGDKGDTGETGATGADGATGATGADGFSPIITVKTNTDTEYVLEIQTTAEGTIITSPNLKGQDGSGEGGSGEKGDKGDTGATPVITIGTVTTLEAGESATFEKDAASTDENVIFNIGIPKGEDGKSTSGGDVEEYGSEYEVISETIDIAFGTAVKFTLLAGIDMDYYNTPIISTSSGTGLANANLVLDSDGDFYARNTSDSVNAEQVYLVAKKNKGIKGETGETGANGFSPLITVNTQTDEEYILDIQIDSVGNKITTPNLKGDGSSGAMQIVYEGTLVSTTIPIAELMTSCGDIVDWDMLDETCIIFLQEVDTVVGLAYITAVNKTLNTITVNPVYFATSQEITDLKNKLDDKQDKLVAGANIEIDEVTKVISADLSQYYDMTQTKTEIQNAIANIAVEGMNYQGLVSSKDELPLSGNAKGDLYIDKTNNLSYVWDPEAESGTIDDWVTMGQVFSVDLTEIEENIAVTQQGVINNAAAISNIVNTDIANVNTKIDELQTDLAEAEDDISTNIANIEALEIELDTVKKSIQSPYRDVVYPEQVAFVAEVNKDYFFNTVEQIIPTFAVVTDTGKEARIKIGFISGETATELILAADIVIPEGFEIKSNRVYLVEFYYRAGSWYLIDDVNNLTISSEQIEVATKEKAGIVKIGDGIDVTADGTISAQGTTYTAGKDIEITEQNVINYTGTSTESSTNYGYKFALEGDNLVLDYAGDSAPDFEIEENNLYLNL